MNLPSPSRPKKLVRSRRSSCKRWRPSALAAPQTRKESPIRDIEGFGFDAEGRICVLSVRKNVDPHLLYVNQQGEVIKDLRVPVGKLPEVVDWSNPVNVGGGKFVVTVSDSMEEGKARCFVADFARGNRQGSAWLR